jgi:hypothetical protein
MSHASAHVRKRGAHDRLIRLPGAPWAARTLSIAPHHGSAHSLGRLCTWRKAHPCAFADTAQHGLRQRKASRSLNCRPSERFHFCRKNRRRSRQRQSLRQAIPVSSSCSNQGWTSPPLQKSLSDCRDGLVGSWVAERSSSRNGQSFNAGLAASRVKRTAKQQRWSCMRQSDAQWNAAS